MGLTNLNTAPGANVGARLHLRHPTKRTPLYADGDAKSKPVTFLLLGKDSDVFIKAEREAREQNVENMRKQAKWSADETEHTAASTLARCTQQWENVPMGWVLGNEDETLADCTFENAVKLYEQPGYAWVKEQVDEFVGEREHFLKG